MKLSKFLFTTLLAGLALAASAGCQGRDEGGGTAGDTVRQGAENLRQGGEEVKQGVEEAQQRLETAQNEQQEAIEKQQEAREEIQGAREDQQQAQQEAQQARQEAMQQEQQARQELQQAGQQGEQAQQQQQAAQRELDQSQQQAQQQQAQAAQQQQAQAAQQPPAQAAQQPPAQAGQPPAAQAGQQQLPAQAQAGQIQGTVENIDVPGGRLTVRSGEQTVTLHAVPTVLGNYKQGETANLAYESFGGEYWISEQVGAGPSANLADQYSMAGTVTGTISQLDRNAGILVVRGTQYSAHPDLLQNLTPGQFVSLSYANVQGKNWVADIQQQAGEQPGGGALPPTDLQQPQPDMR